MPRHDLTTGNFYTDNSMNPVSGGNYALEVEGLPIGDHLYGALLAGSRTGSGGIQPTHYWSERKQDWHAFPSNNPGFNDSQIAHYVVESVRAAIGHGFLDRGTAYEALASRIGEQAGNPPRPSAASELVAERTLRRYIRDLGRPASPELQQEALPEQVGGQTMDLPIRPHDEVGGSSRVVFDSGPGMAFDSGASHGPPPAPEAPGMYNSAEGNPPPLPWNQGQVQNQAFDPRMAAMAGAAAAMQTRHQVPADDYAAGQGDYGDQVYDAPSGSAQHVARRDRASAPTRRESRRNPSPSSSDSEVEDVPRVHIRRSDPYPNARILNREESMNLLQNCLGTIGFNPYAGRNGQYFVPTNLEQIGGGIIRGRDGRQNVIPGQTRIVGRGNVDRDQLRLAGNIVRCSLNGFVYGDSLEQAKHTERDRGRGDKLKSTVRSARYFDVTQYDPRDDDAGWRKERSSPEREEQQGNLLERLLKKGRKHLPTIVGLAAGVGTAAVVEYEAKQKEEERKQDENYRPTRKQIATSAVKKDGTKWGLGIAAAVGTRKALKHMGLGGRE